MLKLFLLLASLSITSIFANDSGVDESDIVYRAVNFVIFIAILFYLLNDKLKAFFTNRSNSIKARLNEVQDRLKASKQEKEDALKNVTDAKKMAEDIIATAKKDAIIISENIKVTIAENIKILDNNMNDLMSFELREAKKDIVDEVIESIFDDDSLNISDEQIAQKLSHKVA